MRASKVVRVVNPTGLHARPCGAIVAAAQEFESELSVTHAGREVNGKSILHLMTLGAGPDSELELVAEGGDAQALLDRIERLFAAGFDE